jgi:hypothetical protein
MHLIGTAKWQLNRKLLLLLYSGNSVIFTHPILNLSLLSVFLR